MNPAVTPRGSPTLRRCSSRRDAYFGCSHWEDVPTWPGVYSRPLGAPLGQATQAADGTWRRTFARDVRFSINFGTRAASIDWGEAGV